MSKRQQMKNEALLRDLSDLPENRRCADCGARNPGWASWNLGVFLCMRCAGIHRKMGTHVSKVKSLSVDSWSVDQIYGMRDMGNKKANSIWDPDNHGSRMLGYDADDDSAVERYIRDKYERGKFRRDADDFGGRRSSGYDDYEDNDYGVGGSRGIKESSSSGPSRWFRKSKNKKEAKDDDPYGDTYEARPARNGSRRERRNDEDDFGKSRERDRPSRNRRTSEFHEDYDYKDKVSKLRDMGFSDSRKNLDALERSNGDILRAIEILTGDESSESKPRLPPRPGSVSAPSSGATSQPSTSTTTGNAPSAAQPFQQPMYDQYGNQIGVFPAQQQPQQQQYQPQAAAPQQFNQLTGMPSQYGQPAANQQGMAQPSQLQQQQPQNLFAQPTGAPFQQPQTSQQTQVNPQQSYGASLFQSQQQPANPSPFQPFQSTATGASTGYGQQRNSLLPQATGFNGGMNGYGNLPQQGSQQQPSSQNAFTSPFNGQTQQQGIQNNRNTSTSVDLLGDPVTTTPTTFSTGYQPLTSSLLAGQQSQPQNQNALANSFSAMSLQSGTQQTQPQQQNQQQQLQQQPQSQSLLPQRTGYIQPQQTGYPQQQQQPVQQQQHIQQSAFAQYPMQTGMPTQQQQPQQQPQQQQQQQQQQLPQGQPFASQYGQMPTQYGQQSIQQPVQQPYGGQPQQQQQFAQPQMQQPMRTGIDKSTIMSLYSHPDYFSSPVAIPQNQQQQQMPNGNQSLLGGPAVGSNQQYGVQQQQQPVKETPSLKPGSHNPFLAQQQPQSQPAMGNNQNGGRASPDAFGQLSAFTGNGGGSRW
ncbi:hypothetical protein BZA70DRAFT_276223 [Myxozyma melibiosi]|uniref:Arf-GAP domain-containing protein n=1 Tax=Myxozyma melibiosi TaxID=54550 RepID=A0ABR1F8X4_9ASCO